MHSSFESLSMSTAAGAGPVSRHSHSSTTQPLLSTPIHPQPFLLPLCIWVKSKNWSLVHQIPPTSALRASGTRLFSQDSVTFSFCTHYFSFPAHKSLCLRMFEFYLKGHLIWEGFAGTLEGSCFFSSRLPDNAHSFTKVHSGVSRFSSLSHHRDGCVFISVLQHLATPC